MNVLLVSSKYPPEYSGSGLRAHRTYNRLKYKSGVRFDVLASSLTSFSWRTQIYTIDNIRVCMISSPFKRAMQRHKNSGFISSILYILSGLDESLRCAIFLLRYAKAYQAVHIFGDCWPAGVTALWARIKGLKVLRELVTYDARPDNPKGMRLLIRFCLRNYARVIAISPRLEETSKKLGFKKIWCRPNPIDVSRYRVNCGEKSGLRKTYTRFGANDTIIYEMSKYIPTKNKDLVVSALKYLPECYKLILCGPIEEKNSWLYDMLKATIEKEGLSERVELGYGFVENPQAFYQLSDVFVFASTHDGLGTTIWEALSCATPVVAVNLPGITDWVIKNGFNGYLCSPEAHSIAEAITAASKLDPADLRKSAVEIAALADADKIDREYSELLLKEG